MAQDQRDYNVERIRQRTDYTEKARFRMSLGKKPGDHVLPTSRSGEELHTVWKILIAAVVIVTMLIFFINMGN